MSYDFQGTAVPYEIETRRAMRRFRVMPGALSWTHPVYLLRDHDNSQRIGRVYGIRDRGDVLTVRGESDDVLPSGTGLSAGMEDIEYIREEGVFVIIRARLVEVSVVDNPAFAGARVEE